VVSSVGFLLGQHAFSSILARDHIEQKRNSLGVMSSRPNFMVCDHRWSRLARSTVPSVAEEEMEGVGVEQHTIAAETRDDEVKENGDEDVDEDEEWEDDENLVIVEPADDPIVPIVMDDDEDEKESGTLPEVRRRRVADDGDDGSGVIE